VSPVGISSSGLPTEEIRALHRSIPGFAPTPLTSLRSLARRLGLKSILVKDESHRLHLKAFKVLGASYAIFRWIEQQEGLRLNRPLSVVDFYSGEPLLEPGAFTFCTATDGNHGRAVAWAANQLQQRSVIFVPENTVAARQENISTEGAEVRVVEGDYDLAVRTCADEAASRGWQIISDTSWDNYTEIPEWVAQGYHTLFAEIDEQVEPGCEVDVTLIPGGVGTLAAAAAEHFRGLHSDRPVKLVSVEPTESDCLFASAESPTGQPTATSATQRTIMAGLNCGSPSPLAWKAIKPAYNAFVTIDDSACREAMGRYARPKGEDRKIVSGESGAATLAALIWLVEQRDRGLDLGELKLDSDTTVLLLNTEGDTDPEHYQAVIRPVD